MIEFVAIKQQRIEMKSESDSLCDAASDKMLH